MSRWKRSLACTVLTASLLTACSKKSDAPAQSDSQSDNTAQPAPAPQSAAPEAPGPNADAKAYVDFGVANGAHGDLDAAISAFNSAINLNPKFAPAYYDRGYANFLVYLWDLFVMGLVLSGEDLIKIVESHMKSTCWKLKSQVPAVEVEESCASCVSCFCDSGDQRVTRE